MEFLKVIKEGFSRNELLKTTVMLSNYHRIQASKDIEEAANYIYRTLKDLELFDTKILKFPYNVSYGNLNPVTGWWVKDAELWCVKPKEELLHSFRQSKTLVVAHSPGGEVETDAVYIGTGDRAKYYEGIDISGKAVVVSGNTYLAYREACRRGASLVMFYRDDVPYDAVPYLSLFLSPDEVKWAKAMALSISRRIAEKIKQHIASGDKVVLKAWVKAGFTNDAEINVVTARLGDNNDEIHVFAHYCHPGGTVNDNASGASLLMELSKVLNEAINRGKLPLPTKHSITFLWYPEYYGSMAYLTHKKDGVGFGVNLDMIGENQELTNSTLNYVRPPTSFFHPYEALIYYELRKALSRSSFSSPKRIISLRFDSLTYESGSDHDVYIINGIPAVMINQWPDTYYHTDQDTIDKFDPDTSILIGSAVGAAILKASTEELDKNLIISYAFEYIGSESYWVDKEIITLRFNYICDKLSQKLAKYVGISINLGKTALEGNEFAGLERPVDIQMRYKYVGPTSVIDLRAILKKLKQEELNDLEEIIKTKKYLRTIVQVLIPYLLRDPKTLNQLRYEIAGEIGANIELFELEKLLNILEKMNLVIKIPA
ncbi:MAG: DUF4910 domain-containing protein [Sulfolobales archaeon]